MPYNESEQLTLGHDTRRKPEQGVYDLMRGLATDIRELKDSLNDHRRESGMRLSRVESELSGLRKELTELRVNAGISDHRLTESGASLKELSEEVSTLKSEQKAQGARIDTLLSKLGIYISLLGIGVSVVLVLFQMLMK